MTKADRLTKADTWRLLYERVDTGYRCCWGQSPKRKHKGSPHQVLLESGDVSTLSKHMKRYHTEVYNAIAHALEHKNEPPIADLRREWLLPTGDAKIHQ